MIGNDFGNIRSADTVADAHPRHTEKFRECAHDDDIFAFAYEIDHGRIVRPVGEFVICLIDHYDRAPPNASAKVPQCVAIQRVPGWVIRIADVDQAHVIGHCCGHCIKVNCPVVLERHRYDIHTHASRIVNMGGISQARQNDTAFPAPGNERCLQRFVRSRGENHVFQRDVVPVRDGLQQRRMHVVRIVSAKSSGFGGCF